MPRPAVHAESGASIYRDPGFSIKPDLHSTFCDPPLEVNDIKTGIANKSDCTEAISQLRGRDVANCSTLENNTSAPSVYAQGNSATPLVTVGSMSNLAGCWEWTIFLMF